MPTTSSLYVAFGVSVVAFLGIGSGDAFIVGPSRTQRTVPGRGQLSESSYLTTTTYQQSNNANDETTAVVDATVQEDRDTRLVWFTGWADLRIHDHGGLISALSSSSTVVPVFVLDPEVHLRSKSESQLRRLFLSLTSLEQDLRDKLDLTLIVRSGAAAEVLPLLAREGKATGCHVVADDVVRVTREAQRATCRALEEMGVDVLRWDNALRPEAPWCADVGTLPSFFPDYCKVADSLPTALPHTTITLAETNKAQQQPQDDNDTRVTLPLSEGIPSLEELFRMGEAVTPAAVTRARSSSVVVNTTEPYDDVITHAWTQESGAAAALAEFGRGGKAAFANAYLTSDQADPGSGSLYAAAAARVVRDAVPDTVLALREAPTIAFASALSSGALGAREVARTARRTMPATPPVGWWDTLNNNKNDNAAVAPSDDPLWGRSDEGSLSDVVEWREWFRLLAERSLALQERGNRGATSGGEKETGGDPREPGFVSYWRWKGQHLVRYLTWPAGKDYDAEHDETAQPAMLLVHGFAASAEQWERLVYSLRRKNTCVATGKDTTPPLFALDLLGFGHSEKPGLTYTQYLWEAQIVDFVVEVMEAVPTVLVGNSIGGGLSCGAAASLGNDVCRGLVLCNTAGVLEDPATYRGYESSSSAANVADIKTHTEAAMAGNPETPYDPVPLFGNRALDLFGRAVIKGIYPQIEDRLSVIYGNNMANADPAVVYAIQQSAVGPGSANVIGSGQKLGPNRPLNEVLCGDGGAGNANTNNNEGFSVLVVMGLDDRVSSPMVAQSRAELFARVNPEKIKVAAIENAGHCPHDEVPDKVADVVHEWMSSSSL